MGVAIGCGCKEIYISSYYLSLLLLYLFFFAAALYSLLNFSVYYPLFLLKIAVDISTLVT